MKNILNEVVGGRYYVLSLKGKGGSAKVYKAKDINTGEIIALKRYITSDPANSEHLVEGLERELNVLRYTSHPVLPQIRNLIKVENDFYLVMEYVSGTNLKELIESNGPMKLRDVKAIMRQVCSGLYYLHSLDPPIVYRDLKPSNIILMDDGRVKLIDFGVAKRYSKEIELGEMAMGSRGFAAPEQFGDRLGRSIYNTDIRTDIYGVGTTIYYLLTGHKYAFGNMSLRIPFGMRRIIAKCTRVEPEKRYQNVLAVLKRL